MTDQDRLRALCPHEFGKLRETVPCQICEWPRPHYEIEHNICPCCGFQPGYDRPEYYQWSGQWWAAGDDRKPRILRALEAAERRIAALCDAHEEAFIAKEAAEARVTVLEAELSASESVLNDTRAEFAHHLQDWNDMRERVTVLEAALRRLMKESAAVLALAEDAIREAAGNTNLAVFRQRIEESGTLLHPKGSPAPEGP